MKIDSIEQLKITQLLQHLDTWREPYAEHCWQGWHVRQVPSGNNLIAHVTREADDWAVKFTIRDDRNRARREFTALRLLQSLELPVAPRPIYLDETRFRLPVVIQSWITGQSLSNPPTDDVTWSRVIQTYRQVHAIAFETIQQSEWVFEECGLVTQRPDQAIAGLHRFLTAVPINDRPRSLVDLLGELENCTLPPIQVVCGLGHGDATIRNMLQTADQIVFVDWEYSGLCDPAHEIAKLMAHPHARLVPEARWQWLVKNYVQVTGDETFEQRINLQYTLALIWWCIRLAYGRSVLLQRPTRRLVGPAPEIEISSPENIELYLTRARQRLSELRRA